MYNKRHQEDTRRIQELTAAAAEAATLRAKLKEVEAVSLTYHIWLFLVLVFLFDGRHPGADCGSSRGCHAACKAERSRGGEWPQAFVDCVSHFLIKLAVAQALTAAAVNAAMLCFKLKEAEAVSGARVVSRDRPCMLGCRIATLGRGQQPQRLPRCVCWSVWII